MKNILKVLLAVTVVAVFAASCSSSSKVGCPGNPNVSRR